jgi:GTPase SAR1 family protein
MDFVTAFVGLPSSGKSSIINSLCFKRLLQSGVCRTTTEYKKLDIDIFDDFNNKFKVIDLPGISDSEENEMKFNDLTYTHIIDANLIVWVSDVHKSFITTHEVDEYNKLKDFITKRQEDTGTIYKIVIMLSKCDKEINYTKKPTIKLTKKNDLEEITDLEEDTNINDLVNKVEEKFPNEDIILFNAYGRSYHNEKSSNTLKTFIRTISGIPTNVNTTFDISKYMKNYVEEQKISYELKFESVYKNFINLDGSNYFQYAQMIINNENKDNLETILNKLNASKLIQLWKKLDKQFIITHLIKICSTDYDRIYQNYLYIIFVVEQLNNEIIKNEQYNIILMRIIDYELSMLNSTDLTMLNFHGLNKCGSIINTIMNTFNKLEHYNRVIVINNILFNNKYGLSITHIQLIFAEFDDIFCYDFKNLFNQFILLELSKGSFNRIYVVLIHLIKKKSTYELKTSTDINKNLKFLQTIGLDSYYILLNKLQILHNFNTKCDYQKLIDDIIKNTGINYHRLMHNAESKKIIIDIWKQIYNNNVFNYVGNYDSSEFKIINKLELLYVDTLHTGTDIIYSRNNSDTDSELEYYSELDDEDFCKSKVQESELALQYVKNQTDEICKLAVKKNGLALQYVKNQTDEICKLAVQENGLALEYVKNQTDEIRNLAVQECSYALQFFKN